MICGWQVVFVNDKKAGSCTAYIIGHTSETHGRVGWAAGPNVSTGVRIFLLPL